MLFELVRSPAMERHDGRIRELIALFDENLEHLMLASWVAGVTFEDHRQWRQAVAARIGERRVQIGKESHAGRVQSFACTHDNAGLQLCAMLVKPPGAIDLSLEQRAIERVLEILRAKFGHGLDNPEAAQVRGMAHGLAPIPAPD